MNKSLHKRNGEFISSDCELSQSLRFHNLIHFSLTPPNAEQRSSAHIEVKWKGQTSCICQPCLLTCAHFQHLNLQIRPTSFRSVFSHPHHLAAPLFFLNNSNVSRASFCADRCEVAGSQLARCL